MNALKHHALPKTRSTTGLGNQMCSFPGEQRAGGRRVARPSPDLLPALASSQCSSQAEKSNSSVVRATVVMETEAVAAPPTPGPSDVGTSDAGRDRDRSEIRDRHIRCYKRQLRDQRQTHPMLQDGDRSEFRNRHIRCCKRQQGSASYQRDTALLTRNFG